MGVFADWQPAYAEAGIATFPVDVERKKPAVGNPLKAGRNASAQWAIKFPQVNALGFACGARSRITILDVDTSDTNVLADAFGKVGASPVVVRTASGKFHAYYRHNGEHRSPRRAAREMGLAGPIDILGTNGFAVAPPSCCSKGAYEFLEGSLADLATLPAMRLPDVAGDAQAEISDTLAKGEGERNDRLWRSCMAAARDCGSHDNLLRFARALNDSGEWSPLPDDELQRAVSSAWKCQVEGRNGFAGDRFVQYDRAAYDVLKADPDAMFLYNLCRAEHWGRDFLIANGWHKTLPLSLARLQKARQFLLDHDLIVCVRAETRNRPAVYRFSTPNVVMEGKRGRGV